MKQAFDALKQELPDPSKGKEYLLTWWSNNGKNWLKKIRRVINEYRYSNIDWNFNSYQQELLHKYYSNNQFLLQCLDSNFNLTFAIKKTIEDTFLTLSALS
jgi:hypothetical protein